MTDLTPHPGMARLRGFVARGIAAQEAVDAAGAGRQKPDDIAREIANLLAANHVGYPSPNHAMEAYANLLLDDREAYQLSGLLDRYVAEYADPSWFTTGDTDREDVASESRAGQ